MTKVLAIAIRIIGVIVFLLGAALAANAFRYANFDFTYGFLKLKQDAIATGWYLPAYYSHVLVAGLILLIGFFQLHPTWGQRWKKLHRSLGYAYVMGILFFSAPGGLVMSFFYQSWSVGTDQFYCAGLFMVLLHRHGIRSYP